MSHHDHECEHEHDHAHADERGATRPPPQGATRPPPQGATRPPPEGANDTRFLDLEITKVLFDEAEGITRKAFRELLEEAAKRHWQARYGERIDALAKLAVDQLIADIEANRQIEATIAERKRSRGELEAKVQAILAGESLRAEPSE